MILTESYAYIFSPQKKKSTTRANVVGMALYANKKEHFFWYYFSLIFPIVDK